MSDAKNGLRADNKSAVTSSPYHNVINSIMSFLPDNRPITSLQIVEDYKKCPKNYTCIQRTYDMDSEADLWREHNLLFGRQTTRYLCISKTEGATDCVLQGLKVIPEKVSPPCGYTTINRTVDTEQRAWRKRQLSYKVTRRDTCDFYITDIILCSKAKTAPAGFLDVGSINGILVCYKMYMMPSRPAPPLPPLLPQHPKNVQGIAPTITTPMSVPHDKINSSTKSPLPAINRLNNGMNGLVLKDEETDQHEYEEISVASIDERSLVHRPAPRPPTVISASTSVSGYNLGISARGLTVGTLGSYTELEGVPFVLNPALRAIFSGSDGGLQLPQMETFCCSISDFEYDFQLERQTIENSNVS